MSFVLNHRSIFSSRAKAKQARAKFRIDSSVLWIPCRMPGPVKSAIFCQAAAPPGAGVNMSTAVPAQATAISELS